MPLAIPVPWVPPHCPLAPSPPGGGFMGTLALASCPWRSGVRCLTNELPLYLQPCPPPPCPGATPVLQIWDPPCPLWSPHGVTSLPVQGAPRGLRRRLSSPGASASPLRHVHPVTDAVPVGCRRHRAADTVRAAGGRPPRARGCHLAVPEPHPHPCFRFLPLFDGISLRFPRQGLHPCVLSFQNSFCMK